MCQEHPSPIKVRARVPHLSLHPEIHLEVHPQAEVGLDQMIHLKVQLHLIKEEDALTRADHLDHLDHQDHREEILMEDHLDPSATFAEVLIRMRIAPGSLPHQCQLQAT